jgi:hypothetical protein
MNIFVTDKDPYKAAKNLCDKHVSKMIVETAQMLANCFSLETLEAQDCPRSQKGNARKHSYSKHPCTIWAAKTKSNMIWLTRHGLAMSREKKFRTDKVHFSEQFIKWCMFNMHRSTVPAGPLTEFAVAISQDQKCRTHPRFDTLSIVEKYREYYNHDKSRFAKWTKREAPSWYSPV